MIFISGIQEILYKHQDKWLHWFVANIYNPSYADIKSSFRLSYYSTEPLEIRGQQRPSQLAWMFEGPLQYYVTAPPMYMMLKNVSMENPNIREYT